MKAKDLMVPIQRCLKPDNTLKEAVNLLQVVRRNEERQGIKGLPVLDQVGTIVGILALLLFALMYSANASRPTAG